MIVLCPHYIISVSLVIDTMYALAYSGVEISASGSWFFDILNIRQSITVGQIFRDLTTLVLQSVATDSSILKFDIFDLILTQNVSTNGRYLCCLQHFWRFISAQNWNSTVHCCAIIFYNFWRGSTQQQCINELNVIFGCKGPVLNGMGNSFLVIVHSKTKDVKVVQNQMLCFKPLMLGTNLYCKIFMWPIWRLRH